MVAYLVMTNDVSEHTQTPRDCEIYNEMTCSGRAINSARHPALWSGTKWNITCFQLKSQLISIVCACMAMRLLPFALYGLQVVVVLLTMGRPTVHYWC